jgi:hypothetical protein
VIKSIAPDIPLRDVIWGAMPFVALMIFAVIPRRAEERGMHRSSTITCNSASD